MRKGRQAGIRESTMAHRLGNANVIGYVRCKYLEIDTVLAVEKISVEQRTVSFYGHLFWITVGEELDLGDYNVIGDMSMLEVKDEYKGVVTEKKEKAQ